MSIVDEVRTKVSIPAYFDAVIVPQLGSYYNDYPVDFDVRPVACCPLHDENTPSMRYYEETNTFYCFGCRRGGDIIQLHRLFMERQNGSKPGFKEAADFLYNYFVKGNEAAKAFKPVKKLLEEKPLNSKVDLARFSAYEFGLENKLNSDPRTSLMAKKMIWKALDEAEWLVTTNHVSTEDAVENIKQTIDTALAVKEV